MEKEIIIPEGYEAKVEGNKVVFVPKESKDEKIIRAIFKALSKKEIRNVVLMENIKVSDALDWLEKQKPVQDSIEKEYVRTLKSLISDFLRGKQEVDTEYYQKIYDWLDGRHIESTPAEWYSYGENETVDKLIAIAECLEMEGDCIFNGYSGDECGKFLRELARKQHYTKRNKLFEKCVENCDPKVMKEVSDKVDEMLQKEQKSTPSKSEIDFADTYSKGVWEKLMSKFKNTKEYRIGCNDVSDIVLNAILDAFKWAKSRQNDAKWSKEDADILGDAITAVDLLGNGDEYSKTHPNLAEAFRVAKIWLKSLPERFNLPPKQEWSEQDEQMLIRLCRIIHNCTLRREQTLAEESEIGKWVDKWINHNPQSRWKPRDAQMEALKEVVDEHWEPDGLHPLYTLYYELKKLI